MARSRGVRGSGSDASTDPVCQVVSAYVAGNALSPQFLVPLINAVHEVFVTIRCLRPTDAASLRRIPVRPTQAQIRASISARGLRSFENGRHYRTLRRHLSSFGLSPDSYRSKWGLPSDYPMTCPLYSKRRAVIASRMVPA